MSKTNETTEAQPLEPVSILQAFTNAGMFAAKDVQPDTIELPDGSKAQFYVRALPDTEFRNLYASGDRAKLIAATICDEDGKRVLTEKQAGDLKPKVAASLQSIALKHAGFGSDADALQEEAGNG
ncbi:hypothetical protein ABK045_20165 [Stenotrophomonas pavanii]|uniref:hypothetical protein n=1 Tax=Stenotrophomonas TaxID=40323 RepID=UPI0021C98E6A|nr:hypothetical protein [Stenotrophomonas sp. Sm5341]MCU1123527.1 hypothetical protein [Stenotrophomonas maltophilia]MDQ7286967.1 hypothetical protein [Stenotrophomonas sp. Sm5341]